MARIGRDASTSGLGSGHARGLGHGLAHGLALALTGALAACATAPDPAESMLAGRLSLQVAATAAQPARGFTGQFELRGNAQRGSLQLSGPLGATFARAQWAAGRYWLHDGQQTREFMSLAELAEQGLGEPLPLQALFDWLQARPWPQAPHGPRADGTPGFEQLGWSIDTAEAPAGFLRATRPVPPPALSLRVRLDPAPRP
ncbi:MAG: outer membrane lipoprotein LolB [Rubrivivax sp.]|nr:outer membrane lipoprotein LolB [Rubrivivax sp.]